MWTVRRMDCDALVSQDIDLETRRTHILTLLSEANAEWTRRRAMALDRTRIEVEIATLARKSRRLEEKIRKAEKRG